MIYAHHSGTEGSNSSSNLTSPDLIVVLLLFSATTHSCLYLMTGRLCVYHALAILVTSTAVGIDTFLSNDNPEIWDIMQPFDQSSRKPISAIKSAVVLCTTQCFPSGKHHPNLEQLVHFIRTAGTIFFISSDHGPGATRVVGFGVE